MEGRLRGERLREGGSRVEMLLAFQRFQSHMIAILRRCGLLNLNY